MKAVLWAVHSSVCSGCTLSCMVRKSGHGAPCCRVFFNNLVRAQQRRALRRLYIGEPILCVVGGGGCSCADFCRYAHLVFACAEGFFVGELARQSCA